MQPQGHPSLLVSILLGALIIWRFYARIRKMLVRQKFSKVRPWITVCALPMLLVCFFVASLAHPVAEAALLGGLLAGIGLGIYGLRLTRYETTPDGLYYTPSAHLGIALSVVLIARVGFRALQMHRYSGGAAINAASPAPFAGTPITLLIFGALAGYYVTYALGLLRWSRSVGNTIASSAPNA
jgi:hypothetical protein